MVSLQFVSALILLDVMFLCTFWTLRNLRKLTDARTVSKGGSGADGDEGTNDGGRKAETELNKQGNNGVHRNGDGSAASCCTQMRRKIEREIKIWYDVFFGCFVGSHRMESNVAKKFPGWEPLPKSVGNWSVCGLLLISGLLLSPGMMLNHDPLTVTNAQCLKHSHVESISRVKAAANLEQAKKQLNYTAAFLSALKNDTTLYGTEGYECRDIDDGKGKVLAPGRKEQWKEKHGNTFFPAYCQDALEMAIFTAKNTECVQTYCECNEVFGKCVPGLNQACIEVPGLCDKHTNDLEDELQDLQDYRKMQLQKATISQPSQLKVTSYDGRFQKIKTFAEDISSKIFRQVDIAGTGYIVYTCMALFFSSPLILFKTPITRMVVGYVFGMRKHVFILLVVAIWWGVEYFRQLHIYTPDVQVYMKKLQTNPCYANPAYIQSREGSIAATCMELKSIESEWNATTSTIQNILGEVDHFVNSCDCPFPLEHLEAFKSPTFVDSNYAKAMGFADTVDDLCTNCRRKETIQVPVEEPSFLGNMTLCTDFEYIRSEVYDKPQTTEASWSDAWIRSGIAAQLMIKFVVSNFCVDLLKAVDPLSDCGGYFEQPPDNYFYLLGHDLFELKETKISVLTRIAVLRSIVWGVLMQWCVLTLSSVVYSDVRAGITTYDLASLDSDILVAVLLLALVPVLLLATCYVNCQLRRKVALVRMVTQSINSQSSALAASIGKGEEIESGVPVDHGGAKKSGVEGGVAGSTTNGHTKKQPTRNSTFARIISQVGSKSPDVVAVSVQQRSPDDASLRSSLNDTPQDIGTDSMEEVRLQELLELGRSRSGSLGGLHEVYSDVTEKEGALIGEVLSNMTEN